MDAKDILGLPKNVPLMSQEKKSRPQKEYQRKPDGISREVYALTGGIAPLMPSIDINQMKRRALSESEKITWQWLPFTSSARKDNLQLYHWVRVVNGVPPTGDYSFAKYNKLCMYLRTYALEQMVQAASSSAGLWTSKRVEQTLQDLGVSLKPKVPTKLVCAEHLELRKDILTLLNLQKQANDPFSLMIVLKISYNTRRQKAHLIVKVHFLKHLVHLLSVRNVLQTKIEHSLLTLQVLGGKELVKGARNARGLVDYQKFRLRKHSQNGPAS